MSKLPSKLRWAVAPIALIVPAHTFAQTTTASPASTGTSASTAAPASGRTGNVDDFHTTQDIVVTAPYVRSLDLFGTIGVVEGDELARDIRPQIGDALARQPGVSATSFSPGASRPVLRGFQGERVRVLVDGIGSIDASNTSADHAVAFDPLTAERIEIVRGPASLLFGSSAIGGAVNIFDRRIPRAVPSEAFHVDAIATYGSAADERSIGGSLDVPLTPNLVAHVDGAYSRSNNLRIGGYQLAPALRADLLHDAEHEAEEGHTDEAAELVSTANRRGRLPNSATESWSAAGGLSWITDGGSLGVSVSYFDSNYGVPERPSGGHSHDHDHDDHDDHNHEGHDHGEGPVTIGLKQWRADLRGEVELGDGFFRQLRIRGGFADYQHTEYEGHDVGTRFFNQGVEARAELVQSDRNGWRGASGVQYAARRFDAIGAEAFVPRNNSEQFALFSLQELHFGALGLELSGRYEHASVTAPTANLNRDFNLFSGAAGLSYALDDASSKIGITLSRTARAPSAEELLSDGLHVATQSYERGNPNFGIERAWSLEGYANLNLGGAKLNVSAFHSWFSNFIYANATDDEIDGFPIYQYHQGDARYYGFEVEASAPIAQFSGFTLSADAVADYVRAKLTNGNGNVPRIPPLRLRGGLELASRNVTLRGEVEWVDAQNRIAATETSTDSFTLVNLSASWRATPGVTLMLSGNNLFDVDARRHASYTKDFVPLAGRDIRVTARMTF